MATRQPRQPRSESSRTPRGIRNNNPLNIRHNPANKWQGMSAAQTDKNFVQFDDMVYGIRAAFIIIHNWLSQARHLGVPVYVRDIISRWAPASDGNNVNAYVSQVLQEALLGERQPMRWGARGAMTRLLFAMAIVETGRRLEFSLFEHAYDMAKERFPTDPMS